MPYNYNRQIKESGTNMTQVIGIDIGGTKINAIIANENGEIICRHIVKTPGEQGRDAVITALCHLIENLKHRYTVKAVGVGTPGYVNVNLGSVIYSSGIIKDWNNVPLAGILSAQSKLPIFIDNDANVAAIGEGWVGAATNYEKYMIITLGTSVGGAYTCKDSGVFHGHAWRGCEIGHSILFPNGRQCLCGQQGCADQYLSGTALIQRYRELGGCASSGQDVFEAVSQCNPIALKVIAEFIDNLAVLLISLQNILDPEVVIIGGGLINTQQLWWDDLHKSLHSKCGQALKVRVLPAQLSNDAGAYGAARLALLGLGE